MFVRMRAEFVELVLQFDDGLSKSSRCFMGGKTTLLPSSNQFLIVDVAAGEWGISAENMLARWLRRPTGPRSGRGGLQSFARH